MPRDGVSTAACWGSNLRASRECAAGAGAQSVDKADGNVEVAEQVGRLCRAAFGNLRASARRPRRKAADVVDNRFRSRRRFSASAHRRPKFANRPLLALSPAKPGKRRFKVPRDNGLGVQ